LSITAVNLVLKNVLWILWGCPTVKKVQKIESKTDQKQRKQLTFPENYAIMAKNTVATAS